MADQKLGSSEAQTLHLYTQGFLTPEQIAKKRGLSPSTIRDHLASLRKKGYLTMGRQTPDKKSRHPPSRVSTDGVVTKRMRLHGEEYNVKVLNTSSTYERAYRRGSDLYIDGNRVRLYTSSMEVYSNKVFWGVDVRECERDSSEYWLRFFAALEHQLNVLLVKPGSHNIKRVKQHVAEVNNELAERAVRHGERIHVKGEDGKEWLLADASWGLRELETVHSDHAVADMEEVVAPFFNDLRERRSRLPSEVAAELDALRAIVYEIGSAVKLLAPREPVPSELDRSLSDYYG